MLRIAATIEPEVGSSSKPDDQPEDEFATPNPYERMRQTARSINDRVRSVLTPPDSVIPTLRILVVDDHPDAADSLTAVMELLGCQVRTTYDAPSAIRVSDEFLPQVCLIDLKMPGMDGFELAGHLRTQAGMTKRLLIATTALADEESRDRSRGAGFHSHLVKPVDVPALVEAITQLWDAEQGPPGTTN
jgi:two-component system OmpR family response regulator